MNKKHFSFLLILLLILGISFYQEKRVDINSSNVKEEIKYHFRNEELLDSHYQKHGIEMGFDSPVNYEIAANKVILNPLSLHKIQDDGDDIYLLEDSGEFVVLSYDGYIRTYFKPKKALEYFNRQ